jgi:hypothetical protein
MNRRDMPASVLIVQALTKSLLNDLPGIAGVRHVPEVSKALIKDVTMPVRHSDGIGARSDAVPQRLKVVELPRGASPGFEPSEKWVIIRTHVVVHGLDIYSRRAAELIRAIDGLASEATRAQLADLLLREYNDLQYPDMPRLEKYLTALHEQLERDARDRGWEIQG